MMRVTTSIPIVSKLKSSITYNYILHIKIGLHKLNKEAIK